MTVELELSVEDVSQVVFSAVPPALHEVNVVAMQCALGSCPTGVSVGRSLRPHQLGVALGVLGKSTPGFLHDAPADIDEALLYLADLPPSVIENDLRNLVEIGRLLPAWTSDLARGDAASRRALISALRHVYDVVLAPSAGLLQPLLAADVRRRTAMLAERGLGAVLNSLHPMVRWDAPVLHNDVTWGRAGPFAERRVVAARGVGLRLIPTPWAQRPTLVIPEPDREEEPLLLHYPVDLSALAGPVGTEPAQGSAALGRLVGAGRARLLWCVVSRPGRGTRELSRDSGLSAASVSEHTEVLRENGLVTTRRRGAVVEHHPTALARRLVGAVSVSGSRADGTRGG